MDLGQDVTDRTRALGPADERNDAERARVVASGRDGDPRAEVVVTRGRQGAREDLGGFPDIHLRTVVFRGGQQIEQLRERVGAHHHVDPRSPRLDRALILLRQAAGHHDPECRVPFLQRFQMPQVAVETVVRVLTDRTRVEHDDACPIEVLGGRHAVGHQQPGDPLRVMLVHLAPEGADQIGPFHVDRGYRTAVTWRTPRRGSRGPR